MNVFTLSITDDDDDQKTTHIQGVYFLEDLAKAARDKIVNDQVKRKWKQEDADGDVGEDADARCKFLCSNDADFSSFDIEEHTVVMP